DLFAREPQGFTNFSRFCQHEPGLAGDGNKLKSLFDATCGGLSICHMDPGGDAVLFSKLDQMVHRLNEFRVSAFEAGRTSHRMMEVIRTDKKYIDSGNAENFVGIFHTANVLDHNYDEHLFIDVGVISGAVGLEICGVELSPN